MHDVTFMAYNYRDLALVFNSRTLYEVEQPEYTVFMQ